jgi:hypothetical protein
VSKLTESMLIAMPVKLIVTIGKGHPRKNCMLSQGLVLYGRVTSEIHLVDAH